MLNQYFCHGPVIPNTHNILYIVVPSRKYLLLTWSAHQYQIDAGVWPKINPGQGISEPTGSRSKTQDSDLGTPQVTLLYGLTSI